jgi:hypothetical protein
MIVLLIALAVQAPGRPARGGHPAEASPADGEESCATLADSLFENAPIEARVAMAMDHYQCLEARWRGELPVPARLEARALADTGEDLLVWGDETLALELLREALALYAAAGLPVDSLLAGFRQPVVRDAPPDVP